jgi:hypothetical protein
VYSTPLSAQPAWEWAVRGYSSNTFDGVFGRGVAVDAQGHVYVAGRFSGTATFADGTAPLTSSGDSDAFLARYDTLGHLQWVRTFGGASLDQANAVAVDADGYVLVAGRNNGPGTFGPYTLTNENFATGFTLKFDPATTNVVWARNEGLEWHGVAADPDGNVVVVGQFSGFQLVGIKAAGPIALAKFNPGGARLWLTNTLAPNLNTSGSGRAIAADIDGNVYITGHFRRVVEFGGTSLTNAASANNLRDEIFVAKFSPAGVPQWARRGGGEGDDQGLAIGVDGSHNVIVAGYGDLTTSLNSGTSVPFDIGGFAFPSSLAGGLGNMVLAKFNSSGTGVWARKIAGVSFAAGVHVAASGEFHVAGHFRSYSVDFGGVTLTQSATLEEAFALKYDASGNPVWGRCTSSTQPGTRIGRAISVGSDGAVYETGEYQGTFPAEFDGTILGSKSAGASMFLAKLAVPGAGGGGRLANLRLLGGGLVRVAVSDGEGLVRVIEASMSPVGFTPIATNTVSGGALEFSDPASVDAVARFYRMRLP